MSVRGPKKCLQNRQHSVGGAAGDCPYNQCYGGYMPYVDVKVIAIEM